MSELYVGVMRERSPEADANPQPHHIARSQRLHDLAADLGLNVTDWGETDDEKKGGHELVEIIVALGGAGAFTALVAALKAYIDKDNVEVRFALPDGTYVWMKRGKIADLTAIMRGLGIDSQGDQPPG